MSLGLLDYNCVSIGILEMHEALSPKPRAIQRTPESELLRYMAGRMKQTAEVAKGPETPGA